jgi:hypothetical protein
MTKPLGTLLVGLALVCGPACGRKGPLELPQGRAPMGVEGFSAAVRGGKVLLSWTNPSKTVSGRPLEGLRAVEIWVFEAGPPAAGRRLTASEVETSARLVRRIPAGPPAAAMTFPFSPVPGPAGPRTLAFVVRVAGAGERVSDFSPPAVVTIGERP